MSGKEDDKATVIIDINALKKQKEEQEKELQKLAGALKFDHKDASHVSKAPIPVLFYLFSPEAWDDIKLHGMTSGADYRFINQLSEINQWIKKKIPLVIVFDYDADSKTTNQLCAQIKSKFPFVKTVIVAKNLNPKKIQLHQQSLAGASAYLAQPLDCKNLDEIIKTIPGLAA